MLRCTRSLFNFWRYFGLGVRTEFDYSLKMNLMHNTAVFFNGFFDIVKKS